MAGLLLPLILFQFQLKVHAGLEITIRPSSCMHTGWSRHALPSTCDRFLTDTEGFRPTQGLFGTHKVPSEGRVRQYTANRAVFRIIGIL